MPVTVSDKTVSVFNQEGAGACIHIEAEGSHSLWIVEPKAGQWQLSEIPGVQKDELAEISEELTVARDQLVETVNNALKLDENVAAVGGMMLTRSAIININRGVVGFMCDAKENDGLLRGGFLGKSTPVVLQLFFQKVGSDSWKPVVIPEKLLGELMQLGVTVAGLGDRLEAAALRSKP